MSASIPLFRPIVSDAAVDAASDVLRSGWLGTGPRTAAFEQAFAAYCGSAHCVGTGSGTDALTIALDLAAVSGREVVTTALTFVATANTIVRAGALPVFADIQSTSGNLDPGSVEAHVTERTAALMIVHYGGCPADLDELRAVARRHHLRVIEDCAHAAGASYRGRPIGSGGDLHAFSFHATKNLTAAGGGALTLDDDGAARRARRLRAQGVDRDSYERVTAGGPSWDYEVAEVGYGAAMSDLHAAVGLAQLELLDRENARRAAIARHYRDRLDGLPGVQLLDVSPDRMPNDHLFVILVDARDLLVDKLAAAQITVGVHYRRLDSHRPFTLTELPATERFWRRAVSLPMHLALRDEDVDAVCDVIGTGW